MKIFDNMDLAISLIVTIEASSPKASSWDHQALHDIASTASAPYWAQAVDYPFPAGPSLKVRHVNGAAAPSAGSGSARLPQHGGEPGAKTTQPGGPRR
ncbi:hypothetical protein [Streptomyces sp. NPDC046161]|uniref:hypothetical protein n=1 Tax=Streptomyces sp. NPDC046161 TaxID=3155132 RepID=UPI00340E2808